MGTNTDILQIKLETTGDGKVKASLAGVSKELGGVEKSSKGAGKGLLTSRLGLAAIGTSAALVASKIVKTTAEFEKLNVRLKTVTGSQEEANRAMAMIKELSSDLPSSVQEITDSFIKLKALGLDPSREALISYSNTAAAMGKDLNQLIEAVADASTGEFERLKDFGIISRTQGDKVSFIFQGVTTTVKKNSQAIQQYLLDIGNTKFADAAIAQMDTLDGAFSNLGDSTDRLMVAIGNSGLGNAVNESTRELSNMASVMARNIEQMGFFEGVLAGVIESIHGDEVARSIAVVNKEISQLEGELRQLERHKKESAGQGLLHKWIHGDDGEIDQQIEETNKKLKEMQQLLYDLRNPLKVNKPENTGAKTATGGGNGDDGPTKEEIQARNKLLDDGRDIYAQTRTEMEQLAITQERLDMLYAEGAIDLDTYSRAMFDAMGKTEELGDVGDKTFERLEGAIRGWGDGFTNTMTEMVVSGKASFADLADAIIRDLIRIAIQKTITDQIIGAATSYFSAGVQHSGGIAGQASSSRSVPASAFIGARRYHSGGIVGDEVPAILRSGEEVLTESDPRHRNNMGGGGQTVKVILRNEGGQQLQADNAGVSFDAEGMVVQVILKDQRNGGPITTGMQRKFGLQAQV